MLVNHCAKFLQKTLLPVFRDCKWTNFDGHCVYSTRSTLLKSCRYLGSMVRHSHSSTAEISYQKLEHRSLVRLCGADVLGFLQGLVTNDMQLLETEGSAMYAMMLNVQACVTYAYYS